MAVGAMPRDHLPDLLFTSPELMCDLAQDLAGENEGVHVRDDDLLALQNVAIALLLPLGGLYDELVVVEVSGVRYDFQTTRRDVVADGQWSGRAGHDGGDGVYLRKQQTTQRAKWFAKPKLKFRFFRAFAGGGGGVGFRFCRRQPDEIGRRRRRESPSALTLNRSARNRGGALDDRCRSAGPYT